MAGPGTRTRRHRLTIVKGNRESSHGMRWCEQCDFGARLVTGEVQERNQIPNPFNGNAAFVGFRLHQLEVGMLRQVFGFDRIRSEHGRTQINSRQAQ
jgi:hypothetical protein